MSVLKTLRQQIAPELNHLYTVPPFAAPAGMEFGWFPREHALHAFFVARLHGAAADLRTGDVAVLSRELPPLTTLGRESKHAWAGIENIAPVDLSLTFAFFGRAPALRSAIGGTGVNGAFEIRYAQDESVLDEKVQKGHEILYIEREVHSHPEQALLTNPYLFLDPPALTDPVRWHVLYGPDIYAKISLHCFRCSVDDSVNVRTRLRRPEAMAWIAQNYPAPETQILQLLKQQAAP
jgi:hypothetical protein